MLMMLNELIFRKSSRKHKLMRSFPLSSKTTDPDLTNVSTTCTRYTGARTDMKNTLQYILLITLFFLNLQNFLP